MKHQNIFLARYDMGLTTKENNKPDHYSYKLRSKKPDKNFVISRTKAGATLSFYGDSTWDFTPYRTNDAPSQSKVYFSELPKKILTDIKWVLFIMLYMAESDRHQRLSVSSIISYTKSIKHMGKFASDNKITLIDLLESENHLTKYIFSCDSAYNLKCISPIISNIVYLGFNKTGINAIGGISLDEINNRRTLLSDDKQHPVIPPRIFSHYITNLQSHIKKILNYKENLYDFLKIHHNHALNKPNMDEITYIKKYPPFHYITQNLELSELFDEFNINQAKNLSRLLARTQHACKTIIHIYSGMRNAEAFSLKINCFNYQKSNDQKTPRLLGETSKLIGQRKTTAWITSKEIENALSFAQWLAKTIAELNSFPLDETPLFISTSYILSPYSLPRDPLQVNTLSNKSSEIINYMDTSGIVINSKDIGFLEKVDSLRSWQDEPPFQLGKVWRFTTHQFRRSLAFYAAQSSLVSLPSLKRQLKHITQEMTIYYANGSGYSNLFDDDDHFSNFYNKSKPEADALSYLYEVILSSEPIYGAHGTFIERNIKNKPNKINIFKDRSTLTKKFKNGELAYQETPLGSCTSIEPCDKKVMREITACIDCKNTVIKPSKLEAVINRQKQLVNEIKEIDSSCFEYRMEKNELNVLIKFSKKILKKKQ